MKLRKCFKHAFSMLVHSKLRSWLTIIGIVIGVASVIAIMSMSSGMQDEMNSRMGELGGDILTLTAGFSRGGSMFAARGGGPDMGGNSGGGASKATDKAVVLDRLDLQVLRGIPDIALIDSEIKGTVNISYMGKTGKVSITGVDQKVWSQITTLKIGEGRMLDSADQNVIVIGGRLASSYFSKPVGINKMVAIQGSSFRVVGILDDESNNIYMPILMAFQVIPDKANNVYDSIVIKVRDENVLNETMIKIEDRLMMSRHVTASTKDFSLASSKQMQETRAAAMSTMSTFLLAIAAVSLLVGAIGVANTMFTSVLEKTKEIGIMKAVGARNQDILLIFLFNSAFIGFVGGIIGIILGSLLSASLPSLMGQTPFMRSSTMVSLNAVLLAVSVSVIVGVLAGLIPAYQASKLKPVDALRYE